MNKKKDINNKINLGILLRHPMWYQTPILRVLSNNPNICLTVLFEKGIAKEEEIKNNPYMNGYNYEFLDKKNNLINLFFSCITTNIKLVKTIKEKKLDVLWIHGWQNSTNLFIIFFSRILDIHILIRGDSNVLNKDSLLKRELKKLLLKPFFKLVSGFIAIGRQNIIFYKSHHIPDNKIFFIPMSIDINYFLTKAKELIPKKNELKTLLGFTNETKIVLYCGRIVKEKNPVGLINAYKEISKNTNSALIFVGNGPLRNELEADYRNLNVQFVGYKNPEEHCSYYVIADIFVLPSTHEPWGRVINEALCFSLPIIVSDRVGAGVDLVKQGINGYIYNLKDTKELTNYLSDLLSNENKRVQMGNQSLKIINDWSAINWQDKFVKFLKSATRN